MINPQDFDISLPGSMGMLNVRIGPREIWAGKFPIRFDVMNAAVRWHLGQFQLLDLEYEVAEETNGLIRYAVHFKNVGNLGEIYLRELFEESNTALIITPPKLIPQQGWSSEQREMIASASDREAKLELMHQLASNDAEAQQQLSKWQEFVFNLFLKEILGDSEVIQALNRTSNHQGIPFRLTQIFKGYDKITNISVEQAEINALYELSDEDIRQKLARIIEGVDVAVLQREARKPHGGFEIGDMDIPIDINGDRFYLCIPVKSAKEIGKTVPEKISYQIFRPFLNFNRCAVVFVTARNFSQNLMNTIKRMKDRLGWSIEIIENKELAQLFKRNNLL
ncbi:MAG: hypothetical protein JXR84_24440 [Anaerolineae bacterium]|nr:hypothetical protein [Anaerolineae bacterium]